MGNGIQAHTEVHDALSVSKVQKVNDALSARQLTMRCRLAPIQLDFTISLPSLYTLCANSTGFILISKREYKNYGDRI
jgi:hypothetical protein